MKPKFVRTKKASTRIGRTKFSVEALRGNRSNNSFSFDVPSLTLFVGAYCIFTKFRKRWHRYVTLLMEARGLLSQLHLGVSRDKC